MGIVHQDFTQCQVIEVALSDGRKGLFIGGMLVAKDEDARLGSVRFFEALPLHTEFTRVATDVCQQLYSAQMRAPQA